MSAKINQNTIEKNSCKGVASPLDKLRYLR